MNMSNIKNKAKRSFAILLSIIVCLTFSVSLTENSYVYAETIEASVTHDYVTDIFFTKTSKITDEGIEGYTFNPKTASYNIMLLDSRTGALSISIDDKYYGNDTQVSLGYNVYRDGEIIKISNKTKPQVLSKKTTSCVALASQLLTSKFKVGESHKLAIKVGVLNDRKDGYIDGCYDIYEYNITRGLSLKSLSVANANGSETYETTPVLTDDKTDPYQDVYAVVCDCESIKLTLTPTTEGTKISINGEEKNDESITIENWKQYINAGEYFADFQIKLSYPNTNERTYTLRVTSENYYPNITEQPQKLTVDKGSTEVLSVKVAEPEKGDLSYQWYKSISKNARKDAFKKIEGATNSTYCPETKYARSLYYYCAVTNKVGSAEFKLTTDIVEVETKKTYLTAPEFMVQPRIQENGSRIFWTNGTPSIEFGVIQPHVGGTIIYMEDNKYQFEVYRNSVDSIDGAEKVNTSIDMISIHENIDSISGETYTRYTAELPSQEVIGSRYYFIKVTVSEDGFDDASCISQSIKLTFKDVADVVTGLEGIGTQADPFMIYDEDDLLYVKDLVEGKNSEPFSFSGQTIAFAKDIELSETWSPIGNIKEGGKEGDKGISLQPFSGIIDGKNYTLIVADHGKSLLNYARKATVKNLNIKGDHIDGYGLLERYVVDYGPNGKYVYDSNKLRVIDIENVTIKKGTKILESGFLGGYASGANAANIRNCKVEEGVVIGYDKSKSKIGSFAGDFNGTLENCISYATVYGVDCVGGLLGTKGQSMGTFLAVNSAFLGKVEASGHIVGGIAGGGYIAASAPGTPTAEIHNCYVDAEISGEDEVGGIIGSEKGHHTYNDTGDSYGVRGALSISDNIFVGSIKSQGKYVGGIIGCVNDFTKKSGEATNFYLDSCGATLGIGGAVTGQMSGVEKHTKSASATEFADRTILNKLNSSETSYKNWIQGEEYPVISYDKEVVTVITIDGEYKTKYTMGDEFSLDGMVITANYSNGKKAQLSEDEIKNVKVIGYDANVHGTQTVTLKYGVAEASITVTVLKQDDPANPKTITVTFSLLGDEPHNSDKDGKVHTLESGNLQRWIYNKTYTIGINDTVWDLLQKVQNESNDTVEFHNQGNYIDYLIYKGTTLAEFTNGNNSGWMYTLNGKHPNLGIEEQFLEQGDQIIFHYTDDYEYEPDTKDWISGAVEEEVKTVTSDKSAGTTTSPTDVKLAEKTNADGTKETVATVTVSADNQKEILTQAKSNKSKEIILQVSKDAVKNATKADVQLEKSFIESVANAGASLTVKTPFGDKSYTNAELKELAANATGKTISLEIVKSEKTDEELKAEQLETAKATVAKASMKARSSKTAKGNIKIVFKPDTKTQKFINEMKDMGYTVKYRFYRSTKKSSGYKAMLTKTSKTYVNTTGKNGTKYYYKVQVRVYDENGKCVAKTALKQCKYATRQWSK